MLATSRIEFLYRLYEPMAESLEGQEPCEALIRSLSRRSKRAAANGSYPPQQTSKPDEASDRVQPKPALSQTGYYTIHGLPQQVDSKTVVSDTRVSCCRERRSACATARGFEEVS